ALIPRTTPGVVVHDDWDALGMRASASNSVSFEDVQLPAAALRGGFRTGDAGAYMDRTLNAGLFHAAAALGVAEGADGLVRRPRELDARAQMLLAENVIELAACRAVLARAAALVDEEHERWAASPLPAETVVELFAEAQSAKAFVAETGVRIVDR